jgi:hypothetical protein
VEVWQVRSTNEISADLGELVFERNAREATSAFLGLLSELTRSLFASGRAPEPQELAGLADTIGSLSRHLPYGRFGETEDVCDHLLDCLMSRSTRKAVYDKGFSQWLLKLKEPNLVHAIHALTLWR